MKRRKSNIVRDICDGKIIKDKEAISIDNIELYAEKNGFKLVKHITIFILAFIMYSYSVHAAISTIDLQNDNQTIVFCIILVLAYILAFVSLIQSWESLANIFGLIIMISGFILLISSFNVIVSILVIVSGILILIGVDK